MNLILTMAGRYSRFINEGYRIPKYLLPWGNRSILCEIISNLNEENVFENIYLVANKRDEIYMPHVREILKALDIPADNLFLIPDTSGQAETAVIALNEIGNRFSGIEGSIVFHNIDTILYNRNIKNIPEKLKDFDGYIDIFQSSNHNYSYVLCNEDNTVESIAEKIVISNNATSGLYAFSSSEKFMEFYDSECLYISELYLKMIQNNKKVVTSVRHTEKDTIVLGTPSEYLTTAYVLDLCKR